MKAGLAGPPMPTCVFPSCIGKPKLDKCFADSNEEFFVGSAAIAKRGILSIDYPIRAGVVADWTDMERVWHHTLYNELRVSPEDHAVLITEAPYNPTKNREKMVEVFFEKFAVPACYIAIQAVMSLYSTGRVTGLVLDSGDGVTHAVPIYEGFNMPHAIQRLNLAGRDVTEYLQKILTEQGKTMTSSSEKDIVRQIKESNCYVAQDFDSEIESMRKDAELTTEYILPDGNKLELGNEKFRAPEIMFQPAMIGREAPGVHELTAKCVQTCDIDLRMSLYHNIVLSGGTTLYKGFDTRLRSELQKLAPRSVKVKVIATEDRRYCVWNGASIVSQLSSFQDMLIWKREYDEVGSAIVHNKCF